MSPRTSTGWHARAAWPHLTHGARGAHSPAEDDKSAPSYTYTDLTCSLGACKAEDGNTTLYYIFDSGVRVSPSKSPRFSFSPSSQSRTWLFPRTWSQFLQANTLWCRLLRVARKTVHRVNDVCTFFFSCSSCLIELSTDLFSRVCV